jgi:CBS domain-containing protein
MTPDPVCIGPDMDAARAVQVLRSHNLSALPVVVDGQLVGILGENHFMGLATQLVVRELGGLPPT